MRGVGRVRGCRPADLLDDVPFLRGRGQDLCPRSGTSRESGPAQLCFLGSTTVHTVSGMPRHIWERAVKGSRYWTTELVNEHPSVLDQALKHGRIEWLSPTDSEEDASYSDDGVLERLGITLSQRPRPSFWPVSESRREAQHWDDATLEMLRIPLAIRPLYSFWPAMEPRWDALGRMHRGAAVFVDAKSHPPEMLFDCQADSHSRNAIERAFAEVWRAWRIPGSDAWFGPYYQYGRRLAHAYLLNELNAEPAFVVFLYFIGATAVHGPMTREGWESPIRSAQEALGVADRLPPYVIDAFVDVSGSIPRAA